jgi:low temperature requirement protein LtrA
VRLLTTMTARDPAESHRTATPLELFFDLTFVVAVAQASTTLHHELVGGHAAEALVAFPLTFFAVWWAWMNFTWFASAYDPDDALYRLAVLVQMAGVLVFAAGVPRFLADLDPGVVIAGYVVMRVGLVAQWLRASIQHRDSRACARRNAVGFTILQVGWIASAVAADGFAWLALATPLAALELAVPWWAERGGQRTSWHPGHIGERYGLFTLIVLGESVLAAALAIQAGLDEGGHLHDLATTAVGGFLVVASMWWIYFDQPVERVLTRARDAFDRHTGNQSFLWGYGHYFVFASAAAVGAGLAVNVDGVLHHSVLTDLETGFAVTAPTALFVVAIWLLHRTYKDPGPHRTWAAPVTATLVLASSWTPEPVLASGLVLAALVASAVVSSTRAPAA